MLPYGNNIILKNAFYEENLGAQVQVYTYTVFIW